MQNRADAFKLQCDFAENTKTKHFPQRPIQKPRMWTKALIAFVEKLKSFAQYILVSNNS